MTDITVTGGVYYYWTLGTKQPTLDEYNQLIDRSRLLWAQEMPILNMEAHVANSEPMPPEWRKWLEYLRSDEAIELAKTRRAELEAAAELKFQQRQQRRHQNPLPDEEDFGDCEDFGIFDE